MTGEVQFPTGDAAASPGRDALRAATVAGIALAALALVAVTLRHGLNGDVTYALGGIEVRGGGLGAAVDTFVHRPLIYRLVVGALDSAAGLAGLHPANQVAYEASVRILADLGIGLAAWSLYLGLRSRLGELQATAIAIATGAALIAAPAWDFLQPEWVASALVLAAVAAALAPRRTIVAGLLSGALLAAAIAVKFATAPYAGIGLALILLVDRRRSVAAALGTLAWSGAGLLALNAIPFERQWVADMIALNPNSPMRVGISMLEVNALVRSIGSKAALSPAVLLLPASIILLAATVAGGLRRTGLVVILVVCIALALVAPVVQGVYYLYHFAILSVLAAAVVGATLARLLRHEPIVALALAAGAGVAGAATATLLTHDAAWRSAHLDENLWTLLWMAVAACAAAAGLVAWFALAGRRTANPNAGAVPLWSVVIGVALMAAAGFAPVVRMGAAWSLYPSQTSATNRTWIDRSRATHATLTALSERIGRSTPVLYLTYGTVGYHMGNPTDCPYPSPVWLRTANRPYVLDLPSFDDNARCLMSSAPEWLLEEPGWLRPAILPDDLEAAINERYDCSDPILAGGVRACPRRP